ncbi:hypothetical protein TNCV_2471661 [Trichonephila clavipes]|nr:hypothetical protein TNCV_2471661 [Trichonephila clavipes]
MEQGVIAYDTQLHLILVQGPMTVQRCVQDILQPLMAGLPRTIFQKCLASHCKDIIRLPPPHYNSSLADSIPRFVTKLAYLG